MIFTISMQDLYKQVSQRLTRLYLVALTVVALLSLFGQILIQKSLNESSDDAHVVNLAGRQRMLSQRLCKMAIVLTNKNQFTEEAIFYEKDFTDVLNLWVKCHYGLKNSNLVLDKTYLVKNSSEIQAIFNEVEPTFKIMSANASIISENKQGENGYEILKNMLTNERQFLKLMDKIVSQYDTEAQARVSHVKRIELILFCITICILIIEGFLIFMPLVRYVKGIILRITESESELQFKNQQLKETNEKLIRHLSN